MMVKRITEEDIVKAEKARTKKMLKVLVPITLIVIILAAVMGIIANKAGGKISVTADDFIVVARSVGYEVFDVKEEIKEADMFDRVLIAKKDDSNSAYFLAFKNKGDAKAFFAGTAKKYKASASEAGVTTAETTDYENYSFYIVTAGGNYKHVVRVKNTVVFADVPENNAQNIKDLIEKMNY